MTKILLVEDDNNLREIYEARLSAEGYTIVAAADGEDALALAAKERPDLIISDVMMPKISGFEMLDILRNTTGLKDAKVIMLTALGQAEDQARADSLGADRYLVKSQVTLEDIVKASHDLMDEPAPTAAGQATPAPAARAIAPTAEAAVTPGAAPAAPATPVPAPPSAAIAVAEPPTDTAAPQPAAAPPAASSAVAVPPAGAEPAETKAGLYLSDDVAPQGIAAEEAVMQAQIERFVGKDSPSHPPADTAAPDKAPAQPDHAGPSAEPAPGTDMPATTVAENPAPSPPASSATQAVQPEPSPPNPAAAPAPATESAVTTPPGSSSATLERPGSANQISGKKVIRPLSSSTAASQPDIHALLALEEAKAAANQAASGSVISPLPPRPGATNANNSGDDGLDPNNIAL